MALDILEALNGLDLIDIETEGADGAQAMTDAAMRAIGSHRLLSVGEEVALAHEIEAGKAAAARLAEGGDLPAAERRDLAAAVAAGQQAREAMTRANMRLVMAVARKYLGRGLSYEDLVQEGTIGLLKAIDRFEPARGFRFSTYATWWVRQAVRRALVEQGRSVRLPEHLVGFLGQVRKAAVEIEQREGRPATIAELAAATETTTDRVEAALSASLLPSSLDAPLTDDGATLGEIVAGDEPAAAEVAEDGALRESLRAALDGLTERQRLVLSLRHGLDGQEPHTLTQIGEKLAISRERARQLEAAAIKQLQGQAGGLRAYLN